MAISDTWDAHLRAIVDDLAPGDGRGVKRAGYRLVAEATRHDEEYVYQVYTGRKRAGQDFASALERAYANGRPAGWINQPVIPATHGETPGDLARQLSDSGFRIPQKPLSLGGLQAMKKIPAAFEVVLADGAMAPDFPAGMRVEFEAANEASPGEHIIVRVKQALHFRLCQQARGGSWEAHATGAGFLDFTPERDGAKVVAVMTGYFVSKRRPS